MYCLVFELFSSLPADICFYDTIPPFFSPDSIWALKKTSQICVWGELCRSAETDDDLQTDEVGASDISATTLQQITDQRTFAGPIPQETCVPWLRNIPELYVLRPWKKGVPVQTQQRQRSAILFMHRKIATGLWVSIMRSRAWFTNQSQASKKISVQFSNTVRRS